MIQQNINQAISLASLLATQNPQFKQMAEKRELLKKAETQKQTEDILMEKFASYAEPGKEEITPGEWAIAEYSDEVLAPEKFQTSKRLAELAKTPEEKEKILMEAVTEKFEGSKMVPELEAQQKIYDQKKMAEKQKKEAELMRAQQEREAADEKIRIEQEQRRETRRRILEGTPYQYKEVE